MRRAFFVAVAASASVSTVRGPNLQTVILPRVRHLVASAADHRQTQRMSGFTSESSQFSIAYQLTSSDRLAGCTGQTWR